MFGTKKRIKELEEILDIQRVYTRKLEDRIAKLERINKYAGDGKKPTFHIRNKNHAYALFMHDHDIAYTVDFYVNKSEYSFNLKEIPCLLELPDENCTLNMKNNLLYFTVRIDMDINDEQWFYDFIINYEKGTYIFTGERKEKIE